MFFVGHLDSLKYFEDHFEGQSVLFEGHYFARNTRLCLSMSIRIFGLEHWVLSGFSRVISPFCIAGLTYCLTNELRDL